MIRAILLSIAVLLSTTTWIVADTLPGPVEAEVLRVIDGDTLEVRARIWLDQDVTVKVRLRGLDTPELKGRCAAERRLALAAKAFVEAAVTPSVRLTGIGADKYAGRVDAWVALDGGQDLTGLILAAGHGRPYDGGRRRPWCAG